MQKILDVGSMNVNGSLRGAASMNWDYTGLDTARVDGLDVILEDPHS